MRRSKLCCLALLTAALLIPCVRPLWAQAPAPQGETTRDPDLETPTESGSHVSKAEAMLLAGQFDDLDRLADPYRREKSRLPGGDWKLHVFYEELDRPLAQDQESLDHLVRLATWVKQRPESITARVALATSLTRWAWVARGHAFAEKTPEANMNTFMERMTQAGEVLDGAEKLHVMCPQWYLERQAVMLALGGTPAKARDLFEHATQFEPDYQYFYTQYVNFLLPKWYGEQGDAARAMKTAADRLGGDRGDLLYFQMATAVVRHGNGDVPVKQFDWTRMQRGYQALVTTYGGTRHNRNQLAFMAWRFHDANVAKAQFAVIQDEWSRGVWRNRELFDRARDWSQGHGPAAATNNGF